MPVSSVLHHNLSTSWALLANEPTGEGVWCEVDLILDEKTPLEQAHDVAETLQYCLEGLNEVDRAFVTVDYSSIGPSGHAE